MQEKKKKSYYRSKRRVYEWDEKQEAWFFTIVNDPLIKKYCYAGPAVCFSEIGSGIIADLITYKMCPTGASMLPYDKFLEIREFVRSHKKIQGLVSELRKEYEAKQQDLYDELSKKWQKLMDQSNEQVYQLLNDKQIFGV